MNTDKSKINQSIIHGVSSRLYPLIDRMQKCSEIKYPNRKWTINFYYECAFQWKDKIVLLEKRVVELEDALNGY
jgi:hypothetical protein